MKIEKEFNRELEHFKPSGEKCPRCGQGLWSYTGESRREWDADERCYVDLINGKIIPCYGCRNERSVLRGKVGFILAMAERNNKNPDVETETWRKNHDAMSERIRILKEETEKELREHGITFDQCKLQIERSAK